MVRAVFPTLFDPHKIHSNPHIFPPPKFPEAFRCRNIARKSTACLYPRRIIYIPNPERIILKLIPNVFIVYCICGIDNRLYTVFLFQSCKQLLQPGNHLFFLRRIFRFIPIILDIHCGRKSSAQISHRGNKVLRWEDAGLSKLLPSVALINAKSIPCSLNCSHSISPW